MSTASLRGLRRREHLRVWHSLCTALASRRMLMSIAVMQRKHSSYAMAIVATLVVLAVAVPVSAIPLTSGTSGPPTLFSDDPGTLVDSRAVPVAPLGGAYTGMLISAVYRDATGRPEFDYQFIQTRPDDTPRLTQ